MCGRIQPDARLGLKGSADLLGEEKPGLIRAAAHFAAAALLAGMGLLGGTTRGVKGREEAFKAVAE